MSNGNPAESKISKSTLIVFALVCALIIGAIFSSFYQQHKNNQKFSEELSSLQKKGDAHTVVINSYIDCRNSGIVMQSHKSCVTPTKSFAITNGFKESFPQIILDIEKLIAEIY